MPGWGELSAFSLLGGFALGTLTALSFWGIGRLLCARVLAGMHASLRVPAECIAGVLVTSLIVQAFAMADASRPAILRVVWFVGVACALAALVFLWRDQRRGAPGERLPRAALVIWSAAVLLGAAFLLAGAAPETRADEISYHLLVTARLLIDGGLRFHPLPWEADVLPQLAWHFALAPSYAVAGSAAGGVASAWLGLLLALSMGRLVSWQSSSRTLGGAAAFLSLAGGYAFVFFSTAGPHAFGYLATFTAVAAVAWSRELRRSAPLPAYVLTVALGCAGALAGKITLLPVMLIVMALAARDVWGETRAPHDRALLLALLLAIPVVTLAPLSIWTWIATGSPLGVLTARLTHSAAFDAQTLAAYEGTRGLFESRFQWRFESAYWSVPMVLCALAALLLERSRERRVRLWLIGGCQLIVLLLLLPKEIRHLGGIQYPMMAAGLLALAERWSARGRSQASFVALTGGTALPWALFVLWIASIYVPLAIGRVTPGQFAQRYAGLQPDYEQLDRRLPADAKLLIGRSRSDPTQYAWYARPPVYYAPRPMLFDTAEVTRGDHIFLMYVGAGAEGTRGPIPFDPWLPAGYSLGRSVYANPEARFYPSRTPRGNPGLARLEVFELRPP